MEEARLIRCDGCGTALRPSGPSVVCPSCRRVQTVPEALLRELGGYEAAVGERLKAAEADRQAMAMWQMWVGAVEPFAQARASLQFKVACPSCGAPNALDAARSAGACGHCRAPLVPTQHFLFEAFHAADLEARRVRMARHRIERRGMVASTGFQTVMRLYLPVQLLGFVMKMAFSTGMQSRDIIGKLTGVAIGLTGIAGAITLVLLYLVRRARWHTALDVLALQFRGRRFDSPGPVTEWLNKYWAGPFPLERLVPGVCFGAVIGEAFGYPCLVLSNVVTGVLTWNSSASLLVLIATELPPTPLASSLSPKRFIERSGFSVVFGESGVVAKAEPQALGALAACPERMVAIAPVVGALSRIAYELKGRPAVPIS